jgi:hypothetical protein
MRLAPLLVSCICLLQTAAFGQAISEFNWVPSGSLDVGVLDSENDSDYRGTGEVIPARLAYTDGIREQPKRCSPSTSRGLAGDPYSTPWSFAAG